MRLIDADALITWFDEHYDDEIVTVGYVTGLIKDEPTIEPETEEEAYERGYTAGQMAQRKKGKWILVTDGNGQHYVCDHCGQWRYHQGQKFCSECGLKMEEGDWDAERTS